MATGPAWLFPLVVGCASAIALLATVLVAARMPARLDAAGMTGAPAG